MPTETTTDNGTTERTDEANDFERQASESSTGLVTEFFHFLAENQKWWLLPIVILLVLLGGLALLTSGVLAPLIYPLF